MTDTLHMRRQHSLTSCHRLGAAFPVAGCKLLLAACWLLLAGCCLLVASCQDEDDDPDMQ